MRHRLDEAIEIRADWSAVRHMAEKQKTDYLLMMYQIAENKTKQRPEKLCSNMLVNEKKSVIEKRFRFIISRHRWIGTYLLIPFILWMFLMSYLFVIEPEHTPDDGALGCEETCTVYRLENGKYEVYLDGESAGIVDDIAFLKSFDSDDIKIEIKEQGDVK